MGKQENNRNTLYAENAGSLSLAILGVLFFMLLIAGHNESLLFQPGDFPLDTAGASAVAFVTDVSQSALDEEDEGFFEAARMEIEIEEFILDYTRQHADGEGEVRKKRHSSEWPAQAYMISF